MNVEGMDGYVESRIDRMSVVARTVLEWLSCDYDRGSDWRWVVVKAAVMGSVPRGARGEGRGARVDGRWAVGDERWAIRRQRERERRVEDRCGWSVNEALEMARSCWDLTAPKYLYGELYSRLSWG
jgi:hypothetical protein